jgi:hypothetical protein
MPKIIPLAKVEQVRALRAAGQSLRTISTACHVSLGSVQRICNGHHWTEPAPTVRRRRKRAADEPVEP